MDWIAIRGIMAAQVVLSTGCTQDEAVAVIGRHMDANAGRVKMTAGDVCSMVLLAVTEVTTGWPGAPGDAV